MKRIFTAGLLGLSLATAPMATAPAAAQGVDTERLAQVLGGLVVLGLAGKAYNDHKDREEAREAEKRAEAARRDQRPDRQYYGRHDRRDAGRRQIAYAVPSACIRSVETRRGVQQVAGARCLQRQGISRGLPDRCATEVRVGNRWRSAYDLRCMRHSGWRVARHR